MEKWKIVPGTEGQYWASNQGRVYRSAFVSAAGRKIKGKLLKSESLTSDTLQVSVFGKNVAIQTLVMLAHCGPAPKGMRIRRKVRDPFNNRLSNLYYAPRSGL